MAALHDIGAGRTAQVLSEAAAAVAPDRTAWHERRSDLDALDEWTVTQPYRSLPQADTLGGSMTNRVWEAAQTDNWGEKLDEFVRRRVGSIGAWGRQRNRPRPI